MTAQSLSQQLANEIPIAAKARVGDHEREQALLCLVDSVACGLAVHDEPLIRRLAGAADAGPHMVLGQPSISNPDLAVLTNAAAIRLLDFNDVYSGRNNLHPSEMVIPLLLSHAQQHSWSGRQLVDAVAVCYRINLWLGEVWEGLLGRGWAPTATTGAVAGAAISSVLAELDVERTSHALTLAAITAPSLGVVFRGQLSDAKSIVNGLAVLAGQQAAQLAGRGVTGPVNAFEGPAGYNELIGGTPSEDRVTAWTNYGPHVVWRKRYPAVFHAHAAIDAAIGVRGEVRQLEEIETIEVRVSEKVAQVAATAERWEPATPEDAQFSLPFCVAVALVHGDCTVNHFHQSVLDDREVRRLMANVVVTPSAEWSTYVGGAVSVQTGQTSVERSVEFPTGHPNSPMTRQGVIDKALTLIERNRQNGSELIDALLNLDQMDDLGEAFVLLGRSAR